MLSCIGRKPVESLVFPNLVTLSTSNPTLNHIFPIAGLSNKNGRKRKNSDLLISFSPPFPKSAELQPFVHQSNQIWGKFHLVTLYIINLSNPRPVLKSVACSLSCFAFLPSKGVRAFARVWRDGRVLSQDCDAFESDIAMC